MQTNEDWVLGSLRYWGADSVGERCQWNIYDGTKDESRQCSRSGSTEYQGVRFCTKHATMAEGQTEGLPQVGQFYRVEKDDSITPVPYSRISAGTWWDLEGSYWPFALEKNPNWFYHMSDAIAFTIQRAKERTEILQGELEKAQQDYGRIVRGGVVIND